MTTLAEKREQLATARAEVARLEAEIRADEAHHLAQARIATSALRPRYVEPNQRAMFDRFGKPMPVRRDSAIPRPPPTLP